MSDTDLPAASPGPRGLTGEQDGRLRTLAALGEHGELAPDLQELHRSYRERDQRAEVRPPSPVTWPVLEERSGPARPPLEEHADRPSLVGMTGPSEVDPAVLAGDPGSAQQLERGDDDLLALGQEPDDADPDDGAPDDGAPADGAPADAPDEGRPAEPGGPH